MVTTATRPRGTSPPRPAVIRVPRLCLALQAPTVEALVAKAEYASRDVDFLEFRLDLLKQPQTAASALEQFLRSSPHTMAIATCRRQACGGGFKGTVEAELAILKSAAKSGCGLVDLELQSAERLGEAGVADLRRQSGLVLSYHDFKTTPALAPLLARLRRFDADFYKLVPTATVWKHNLDLLRALETEAAGRSLENLVAFCMGEAGLPSRLLSLRAGTAFTFGALAAGDVTAPGQPTLDDLRNLYRVDTLSRATQVYGVLGFPLAHSLSPRMQNAAFRRTGVNALYLPLETRRPEEALKAADAIPLHGFSITHPYKSDLLERLERLDPLAREVGAINTVVRSQGKFYGYNTDVAGIVEPLAEVMPLRGARVLVLGAGGAARAAVFGLRSRGAQVFIHNRTRSRADKLASQAKAKVVGRSDLKKLEFNALIHATPVGQFPKVRECPLKRDELHAAVVFDLVYNPMETELLRLARAAGARVIPGAEMFVRQGARQFELWTGKPAPLDEMRRALHAALAPAP